MKSSRFNINDRQAWRRGNERGFFPSPQQIELAVVGRTGRRPHDFATDGHGFIDIIPEKFCAGCCQSNGNSSQERLVNDAPSGSQLAPFCERSGTVLLVNIPAVEMMFVVEVIVDGGVG